MSKGLPEAVAEDSRTLVTAAAVNLLGVLARSSRALATLFITRVSGPATYGLFTLATAVVEVVTRFSIFGMDKSLLKFIPEEMGKPRQPRDAQSVDGPVTPDPVYQLLAASLLTAFALSLALIVGLLWTAPWVSEILDDPGLERPLRLISWSILPITFVSLLMASTKALRIMRYDALVTGLVLPLSLLLFAVPIIGTEDDTATLSLAYGASYGVGLLIALFAYRRHFRLVDSFLTLPGAAWKRMMSFSAPLGLHDFVQYLAVKLELFILAFFTSSVELGIYALAAELSFVVRKFRQIFDPILIPVMSSALTTDEPRRVEANVARVVRWILLPGALYVGVLAVFSRPVLGLFGPEFAVGAGVLVVLCVAQLLNACTGLLDMAMMVSGRPAINLLNVCIVLTTQTGLNLWLIPRHGLMGAAWAALCAYLVVSLVRYGQSVVILGLNPLRWSQAKPLIAASVAMVATIAVRGVWAGADASANWLVLLVGFVLLYLSALVLLRLDAEDIELLGRSLRKWSGRRP